MLVTIHRGANEIGGSCVEIATQNSRVLIDAGLPLSDDKQADAQNIVPHTLSESFKRTVPLLSGIVISHPHMDHYGLLPEMPKNIPIYCGKISAALMALTFQIKSSASSFRPKSFSHKERFIIGDIALTPYIVDHSGFDSYAFLIEAGDRRIFYSGDFRDHGRKGQLVKRLFANPPSNIDALLLEGTTVGQVRGESTQTEEALEADFKRLIDETTGPVFVTMSGQNIDRIVTVFKAAKDAKRFFIIDPYIAEVLDQIRHQYESEGLECRIPHSSWPQVKVSYPQNLCRWLKRNGRDDILKRNLQYGVKWRFISENQSKIVMIVRPSSPDEILKRNYFDLSKARWIYSMWQGYLESDKKLAAFSRELRDKGVSVDYLHTSGHATVEALQRMALALKPRVIIPIHTSQPDKYEALFSNVVAVQDGVPFDLN